MKTTSLTVVPTQAFATVTVVDYTHLSGAVLTVGGTALTEGVDWDAATDNSTTAASLASAVGNLPNSFTVGTVGGVITATEVNVGTPVPATTLATSNAVYLTISGPSFGGGTLGVVGTTGRAKTLYGLSVAMSSAAAQLNIYDGATANGIVLGYYPMAAQNINIDFGQGIVFKNGMVVEIIPDDPSHLPTQVSLRFTEI